MCSKNGVLFMKLISNSNFKYRKMVSKPPLTATHKANRLNFAKDCMTWDEEWKSVIFSDEKKINLDGPDGYRHYWHDIRKRNDVAMSRNFGGGSVMVWSAFHYESKAPICFITTRMNSEKYVDLLENVLIQFIEDSGVNNPTFQQDNAPIHTARHSKIWFEEKNIKLLKWPACSPDLNPIENLWGELARRTYSNNKQYQNALELKNGIKSALLNWKRCRILLVV